MQNLDDRLLLIKLLLNNFSFQKKEVKILLV